MGYRMHGQGSAKEQSIRHAQRRIHDEHLADQREQMTSITIVHLYGFFGQVVGPCSDFTPQAIDAFLELAMQSGLHHPAIVGEAA